MLRNGLNGARSPIPWALCRTQARSYKNEIIQFVMAGERVAALDMGLSLAFNLRDLGYDHWFVHGGHDNRTCVRLLAAMPDAGAPGSPGLLHRAATALLRCRREPARPCRDVRMLRRSFGDFFATAAASAVYWQCRPCT